MHFFGISLLSPLRKHMVLHFKKKWIPFTQGCLILNLVEIGPVVLEEKFLKFVSRFSFWNYLFALKNKWITFTQGCFVSILVEIIPVVLKKILKHCRYISRFFVIISFWKRAGSFIWRMFLPTFGLNWANCSGKEDLKKCQCVFAFP